MKIYILSIVFLLLSGCASSAQEQFVGDWTLENASGVTLSITHTGMGMYEIATMRVSGQCGVGDVMRAHPSGKRLLSRPYDAKNTENIDPTELWIDPDTGHLIVVHAWGEERFIKK